MSQTLPKTGPQAVERPRLSTRLGENELKRRLWHMSPGLLPFLLWPIPHADPISPTLRGIMVTIIVGLGIAIFVQFRRIARNGEYSDRLAAVAGYAGSVLLMLLLFPNQAELGLTVLAVLAFGDGSATLGGKLLGGPKLPWNDEKTISGFACFVLVGVPMASIIYWGETHNLEAQGPPASWVTALICGGAAAIAAAIVESLPSVINDNIRVGVTAAVVVVAAHGATVGWS